MHDADLRKQSSAPRTDGLEGGAEGPAAAFFHSAFAVQKSAIVVAEAGVNHDGDVDVGLRLVDAAAAAGADAVKFQVFRAAELVTAGARTAAYQSPERVSQRAMLAGLELSDRDFARLAEHCRAHGVEFLATPFSPADVERVLGFGVRAIKIASTDIDNVLLLRAAAATGLPLIVSTGAATAGEIATAVRQLRALGAGERLMLLHCISGYPTPLAAANLRAIRTLREAHRVPVGFSDHTRSTEIAGWAVAAGAMLLEKHLTLDQTAAGPDHAASLNPAEFQEYVAAARRAGLALGTGVIGTTAVQEDVRSVARRSVVARVPIVAGTRLTPELLTLKRPGGGIPAGEIDGLIGRRAARDIAADTVLARDMVE